MSETNEAGLPFHGIRVPDLATVMAGPVAALSLGADALRALRERGVV